MGEFTAINWCDSTFNPWVGCTKVSPACDHCYAEGWAKRGGNPELWQGERRKTKTWNEPRKWQRQAAGFFATHGRRRRVFCASLADVFDNQVPAEWRDELWTLIRETPNLDWLILTKRPQNMAKMLPIDWGAGYPNVALGVTAEDQDEADRRIPILLKTPAARRFVSYEPALGPIDFTSLRDASCWRKRIDALLGLWSTPDCAPMLGNRMAALDWIIAGGESGPNARPAPIEWFRSVKDQCRAAGVPFLMKQLSQANTRDFKKFETFPPDLQIREFPPCNVGFPA